MFKLWIINFLLFVFFQCVSICMWLKVKIKISLCLIILRQVQFCKYPVLHLIFRSKINPESWIINASPSKPPKHTKMKRGPNMETLFKCVKCKSIHEEIQKANDLTSIARIGKVLDNCMVRGGHGAMSMEKTSQLFLIN